MATQANWRFCTKCYSLFWYGYSTAGVCPGGGAHSPLEAEQPHPRRDQLGFRAANRLDQRSESFTGRRRRL